MLVALLVAAAVAVTLIVGTGARAAGEPAHADGGFVKVLAPRPGRVIVARTTAGAHRLRLYATLSITRPVDKLALLLNGHPIGLPARSGRVRVLLDAADGLVVGENLLWIRVDGRDGRPTVPFVVGYRGARALGVRLHLRAGSGPAAASLRAPRTGVDRLSITLNGRPVRVPEGARLLDLLALARLHWGSNRLRVRLVMLDGQIDDWTRTFRLDPRRDVAVARLDGRPVVGRTVVLDARRSLIVRGARQARGFHWVLVRRPPRSHARLGRTRGVRIKLRPDVPGDYLVALKVGSGPRRGYGLVNVSASYPEPLVPLDTIQYDDHRIPGVRVENDFYPDPNSAPVQVLVLARNNLGLIHNYGLDPNDIPELAEILRQFPDTDLAIVTHPGSTQPLPADSLSYLDTGLKVIGGSLPAKWALSAGDCWSGGTQNCVSHTSNGNVTATWQQGAFDGGSFTVVGIPGLDAGQAWRETATQAGGPDGTIRGYLTRADKSNAADYTVVNGGPNQYAAVDTCPTPQDCDVQIGVNAAGTTSAGSATITSVIPTTGYADGATIEGPGIPSGATIVSGAGTETLTISSPATASATVGLSVNQSYPSPDPDGFQVVVLDRTTLSPILNATATTPADLLKDITDKGSQQTTVGHFVGSMDDQRLIIIRSVGDGRLNGEATTPLLQYIDELGGTPDLLLDAMTGRFKYALVGAATDLPWRNAAALESSSEIPGTPPQSPDKPGGASLQTGRISGALQRDRDALYAPVAGDPIATTNVQLYKILYQPATTSWPWAGDPALPYIANSIGLAGHPDVRSAYVLTDLSWASKEDQLRALTCTTPSLCGANFEAVKAQLLDEFGWVQTVDALADNLVKPYTSGGSDGAFDIRTVYLDVKATEPTLSDTAPVSMGWLTIMSKIANIAAGLVKDTDPLAAAIFGLASSAGSMATYIMPSATNGAGAPADMLKSTAGNLATELNNQVLAYEAWVSQMQTILLTDYGKLKAVGAKVGGDPAWDWTPQLTTRAVDALRGNTRAAAYSALLPKVWPGYNLKPSSQGEQQSSNDVKTLACDYPGDGQGQHQYPFAAATTLQQFWWSPPAPDQAGTQFQAITSLQNGARVDQAWTFAKLDAANWEPYSGSGPRTATPPPPGAVPPTDKNPPPLTYYIYGARSTDTDNGAYQFAPVWWRDTYNPPAHTLCVKTPGSADYWSTQYDPPNIPAPPP